MYRENALMQVTGRESSGIASQMNWLPLQTEAGQLTENETFREGSESRHRR